MTRGCLLAWLPQISVVKDLVGDIPMVNLRSILYFWRLWGDLTIKIKCWMTCFYWICWAWVGSILSTLCLNVLGLCIIRKMTQWLFLEGGTMKGYKTSTHWKSKVTRKESRLGLESSFCSLNKLTAFRSSKKRSREWII